MSFEELKRKCSTMQISVEKIAEEIGLSYDGLKKGIINGSLSIRYVIPLCNALYITTEEFFGKTEKPSVYQIQNGGISNTQNVGDSAINDLREQLKVKDAQIDKLLNLLNK